ncbi:MAG: PucR family transcriptional regulator [Candidatus Dormibacteria bacterium]
MRLAQALMIDPFSSGEVVAGRAGLDRELRWVDVVDIPNPLPWVGAGQLLLTTGISWPQDPSQQRRLVRELASLGLAGVALAVPQYLSHFPEPAREEADAVGLPLVEVPWEVPFTSITQAVNSAIMAEQFRVIEQSSLIHKELTKAALTAGSLQDLVDTLGRLIERDITLEDPEGRLLAHWSNSGEQDAVRRATLAGGATPDEVLLHLESAGHLARVRNSPGPVRIPAAAELALTGRVACPIWLRGELVGTVWIVEGEDELSELHLRAAEHAAVVAALHIASQRQLAMVELRLGASFLDALLEGRLQDNAGGQERARLLGFDEAERYRTAVAALPAAMPLSREDVIKRDRLAERIRLRLGGRGGVAATSTRLNRVVFLLPAGFDLSRLRGGLEACAIALGREHPGAGGVSRSYREALAIVAQVPVGEIRQYEDMLVLRVLSGDEEARGAFLEQLFGPLRRVRGGDVLVASLIALAESGFHQRQTAARLHVHPNTLRYRLERAGDLLRLDLTAPEIRFQLQLAAHLMSLGHKPSD